MPTVAENIVQTIVREGVETVWGVVGDALNPVTDAIRRQDGLNWIGVRHEEVGAFAAGAQAQLTGKLGVCMGTVGPGSVHLLNGLYDAKKSYAPVLAICGQVPLAELGSDFFQEVDNDRLFEDVSVFCQTVTDPAQMPRLLDQAIQAAFAQGGVAVLTLPGDIGSQDLPSDARPPRAAARPVPAAPEPAMVAEAADLIDGADKVCLLAGIGARHARTELLSLAERIAAPMVLTIKAKEGLEAENPFQVGQSGLIGNPAAQHALDGCDLLVMVGTDFPYPDWLPDGKTVLQIDARGEHIGRRTHVDLGLVGDSRLALTGLLERVAPKSDRKLLEGSRKRYETWAGLQKRLTDPEREDGIVDRVRSKFDNPDERIRPEMLAAAVDRHAADDAIFTTDTGMATVWLSRFVEFGAKRRLIGSFGLGSMANALPQALGAQALDRERQVVAFCGDGGLTMLLGDLITAVTYDLPVRFVVFDNGRLGMVKLEQEQGGMPEHGTDLANPDLAALARAIGMRAERVTESDALDGAVSGAFAGPGPVLLDVVTNPDEVSLPPKLTPKDAWGFAIAKSTEVLQSR